jgi:hypothetical protein
VNQLGEWSLSKQERDHSLSRRVGMNQLGEWALSGNEQLAMRVISW